MKNSDSKKSKNAAHSLVRCEAYITLKPFRVLDKTNWRLYAKIKKQTYSSFLNEVRLPVQ